MITDERVADYALQLLAEDRISEPLDLAFARLWRARRSDGEAAALAMLAASVVDVVRAVASPEEIRVWLAEQEPEAAAPTPGEVMPLGALAAGVRGKWVGVLHAERGAMVGPVDEVRHWSSEGHPETLVMDMDRLRGQSWPSRTPCVVYDSDPAAETTEAGPS